MDMEGAALILSKVALRYAWHAVSCRRRFSGLNWNTKRKKSAAIWGGAAVPDPVNERVFDWPAFAHGYLTGGFLHMLMCLYNH